MSIFKIVAGVLNVGNIEFEADVKATEEDGAKVKNEDAVAKGYSGVDTSELKRTLTSRNIDSRSVIMVSYIKEAMTHATPSPVHLRQVVRQFIVRINDALMSLASGETAGQAITCWTFRLRTLETNHSSSCASTTPTKSSIPFNEHIFKLEQREYAAEGVDVPDTTSSTTSRAWICSRSPHRRVCHD